jgi:hypothetical protein
MVDLRDTRRAEARKRRVLERLGADQRDLNKHLRIGRALDQMRLILADETFSNLVHTHGIQSVPGLLSHQNRSLADTLDRSLDFIVAWRFFSPFIYDPVTAVFLETRWPGFSLELRDIFISVVADGPFPQELRGRDRRTIGI